MVQVTLNWQDSPAEIFILGFSEMKDVQSESSTQLNSTLMVI